jgi:ribonuclease HI
MGMHPSLPGLERLLTGGSPVTTNNQMELRAVSMGLRALQEPCDVSVFTDSKYVQEGMSRLVPQWKANPWRNGRQLPNRRLWLQLASCRCTAPDPLVLGQGSRRE